MARGSGGGRQRSALLGLGFVGLVLLAVLWNKAPTFYVHATDPDSAVATTRTGILIAITGVIGFTGVMLNLTEIRRTNELTRLRDEQAREQDRLTHKRELAEQAETRRANDLTHAREREAQLTERYTRAVDQLGSDTLDVRLGGIYALERLARDSPPDQPTIVEVLSAFARVRSTDPALRPAPATPEGTGGEPEPAAAPAGPVRPAVDVHAAVTVLARLPVLHGVPRADLTGADLTGPAALHRLHVPATGSLADVDLTDADLTGARLAEANLTSARFARANLKGAVLKKGHLSRAVLVGADLTGARLDGANLTGAALAEATLTGARLDGANLAGATLANPLLTGTRGLTQAQLDAAVGDGTTVLPEGLARPAGWPEKALWF